MVGTTLGPYRIVEKLGAGGMGEVYKAHDTRLGRTVALKLLRHGSRFDPHWRARLEREARAVAALSHPHICTLHDIGDHDGTPFLVMEYLEGQTLAARLLKGPLPIEQALAVAAEIADALAAAHHARVVHRDLKPANIMLTRSGAKLLDFGVAKLAPLPIDTIASAATTTLAQDLSVEGTVVGTLAYMSPEQAQGHPADPRSDIFAFGAMLYETVTGRRAFAGSTPAEILTAVLQFEPPRPSSIQPLVPPRLDALVARCLAKDRDGRWESARDLGDELRWIAVTIADARPVSPPRRRRAAALLAAGVAAGAIAGAAIAWWLRPSPADGAFVTRSEIAVRPASALDAGLSSGAAARTAGGATTAFALSPSGRSMVFVGVADGTRRLYVRRLDQPDATALPGTEGAHSPIFSSDGAWIAFWAGGWIKKVPADGGTVMQLAASAAPFGLSWGSDNRLVGGSLAEGLWRISADGGAREMLTRLRDDEVSHRLPHVLPGAHWVIFTARRTRWLWGEEQVVAQSLTDTADRRLLVENAVDARYVPGYLLYLRSGTMMARPFDPETLAFGGIATGVLDKIVQATVESGSESATGAGQYSVSSAGTLAYLPGDPASLPLSRLVSLDRGGRITALPAQPAAFTASPRLLHNANRIIVGTRGANECALWLINIANGSRVRLTTEGEATWPLATPGSGRVTFLWRAAGTTSIAWVDTTGSGAPQRLTREPASASTAPGSWLPDGSALAVSSIRQNRGDIELLAGAGAGATLRPLISTKYSEDNPEFSPDGRWLAFVSDEAGRDDVYVQPYPARGERVPVSVGGGDAPAWSPDGRELFYVSLPDMDGRRWLMSVAFRPAAASPFATPQRLFQATVRLAGGRARIYDVFPDGQRFLAFEPLPDQPAPPVTSIHLVQNWSVELASKVPRR